MITDDSTQTRKEPTGELLAEIAANVPIIVFAVDRNGVVTHSVGKGLQPLGLKPGELLGKSLLEVCPQLPDIERHFRRALSGETTSTSIEIEGLVLEFWHAPLRDRQGRTTGVAGVAIDVTPRERAEQELRSEQQMMERMLQSHERDRKLIAYEIHDGLVQDATAAQMQLQTLLASDQLSSGFVRDQVQLAAELISKAVSEARRLIGGLSPPILDELGLVAAIEYRVAGGPVDGPAVKFTADVRFDRLEPLLETTLYRIVQEAITNIRRHSQSDRAEIRLTQVNDRIHLEIEDWGIGFDPAGVLKDRFGLQGIRERARLLRGRVIIKSAAGKGTRIVVDLPAADALNSVASANVGVPNE